MKMHKSQHVPAKKTKRASLKKLSSYIDKEVTLIHENLEELKGFLGAHRSMQQADDVQAGSREVKDYYDSANDLFKQIALENDAEKPIEAHFYETLILRKKKKNT